MKIVVRNGKSFKKNSHGEKAAGVVVCVKTRKERLFLAFVLLACVSAENACRREFTQFMTDHVFSYINRDEFVTIMNCDSKSDKIRRDH